MDIESNLYFSEMRKCKYRFVDLGFRVRIAWSFSAGFPLLHITTVISESFSGRLDIRGHIDGSGAIIS
jgi:hypothetical protein